MRDTLPQAILAFGRSFVRPSPPSVASGGLQDRTRKTPPAPVSGISSDFRLRHPVSTSLRPSWPPVARSPAASAVRGSGGLRNGLTGWRRELHLRSFTYGASPTALHLSGGGVEIVVPAGAWGATKMAPLPTQKPQAPPGRLWAPHGARLARELAAFDGGGDELRKQHWGANLRQTLDAHFRQSFS